MPVMVNGSGRNFIGQDDGGHGRGYKSVCGMVYFRQGRWRWNCQQWEKQVTFVSFILYDHLQDSKEIAFCEMPKIKKK